MPYQSKGSRHGTVLAQGEAPSTLPRDTPSNMIEIKLRMVNVIAGQEGISPLFFVFDPYDTP